MGYIFTSFGLSLHFDTVILIGMVLAFLLNAFFYVSSISKNISLLVTSFIMAASYFTSNHFIDLSASRDNVYLSWILYDAITIVSILLTHKLFRQKLCVAGRYVLVGLSINALLCLLLHIDLWVIYNREPWWFWYFYTLAINTIDVVMVAALILDRDFLGSTLLKRKFKKRLNKSNQSFS